MNAMSKTRAELGTRSSNVGELLEAAVLAFAVSPKASAEFVREARAELGVLVRLLDAEAAARRKREGPAR